MSGLKGLTEGIALPFRLPWTREPLKKAETAPPAPAPATATPTPSAKPSGHAATDEFKPQNSPPVVIATPAAKAQVNPAPKAAVANPATGLADVEYRAVPGAKLFAKGTGETHALHPSDIKQGAVNDCWLLSSIGAIAQQKPALLEKNLKDHQDGTFTVTFFRKDPKALWDAGLEPVQVTVSAELPQRKTGDVAVFAEAVPEDGAAEIWVPIFEKAYAQLIGGYDKIANSNGTEGMALLTGAKTQQHFAAEVSLAQASAWFARGDGLTAVSMPSDIAQDMPLYQDGTLVAEHVYFISKVDPKAGTVELQNPYGWSAEPISMAWGQFQEIFGWLDHGELP